MANAETGRPLPNPESAWKRPEVPNVAQADIERRIGAVSEPWTVLSGGLANLNIRIGESRLLRVYLRDPGSLEKERALLLRPWPFRVPLVLASGGDFLLLEYVPHTPLQDTEAHGAAAGAALAAIHAKRYPSAGFLDSNLALEEPLHDFVDALRMHVLNLPKRGAPPDLCGRIADVLERLELAAADPVLLHGDFKASNLHWADDDAPLILDWEFAYAGPALMDAGQLFRWHTSPDFRRGFAAAYRAGGGELPEGWVRVAEVLDLANLAGLLANELSQACPRRKADLHRRAERTLREP